VANDLYSVHPTYGTTPTGSVLHRFTSDGAKKSFITWSPNGDKVAYLDGPATDGTGPETGTFLVVDESGRTGKFELDPGGRDVRISSHFAGGDPYLVDLKWNSEDVLRLTKWWGKDYARFEFRNIGRDISGVAAEVARPVAEYNCVIKGRQGPVACIDQGGFLSIGHDTDHSIYSVPVFSNSPILETFELHVGQSYIPWTVPDNTVTIVGVSRGEVEIKIAHADPRHPWKEEFDRSGTYTVSEDYGSGINYGFFVTILNQKSGLVRVDVRKDDTPDRQVDRGLAWQPRGLGLLFIRRSNTGAYLDLIRPGRGDDDGRRSRRDRGPQWHLAAEAAISMPDHVRSMRFLTPSWLLLDTGVNSPLFRSMPVTIARGPGDGKSTLTVGDATLLPPTLAVSIKGHTTQAPVWGWSCAAPHRDGDHGNHDD